MQLYSEKAESPLRRKLRNAAGVTYLLVALYGINTSYNFHKGVSLRDKINAVELRLSTEETNLEARAHAEELIKSNRQELMESREKMTNPFYNLF